MRGHRDSCRIFTLTSQTLDEVSLKGWALENKSFDNSHLWGNSHEISSREDELGRKQSINAAAHVSIFSAWLLLPSCVSPLLGAVTLSPERD